jgi:hypothetical protein
MTLATLTPLLVASLIKGAVFGALFAWLFPPLNTFLVRKMGRDPGALERVPFGSRLYFGMAVLSGSGFALLDLIGLVSEAAGLPETLRLVVTALFALSVFGALQIAAATRKPDPPTA